MLLRALNDLSLYDDKKFKEKIEIETELNITWNGNKIMTK